MVPRFRYRSNEDEAEGGQRHGRADQSIHRDWDQIQRRSGQRFREGVIPPEGFKMFWWLYWGILNKQIRVTNCVAYLVCGLIFQHIIVRSESLLESPKVRRWTWKDLHQCQDDALA